MANIHEVVPADVSRAGRQDLRRPAEGTPGRRHPLQQEGLRRARAAGAQDLGRVHGQQREDQGGRQSTPVIADLQGHLDLAAVRAGRLLQRPGRRAELRRGLHRQQGQVRDTPAAHGGLPAPGGGVQGKGYLNKDYASANFEEGLKQLADRQGRALPDADRSPSADHGRRTSRTRSTTSASSAMPGDDAAKNGADHLGCRPRIYIPKTRPRQARRGEEVPGLRRHRPRAATRMTAARRADRARTDQGLRRCPTTCRRRSRTCSRTSTTATTSPALEFLSPVKGPSLEQITVAVGSGLDSAAEGAKLVRPGRGEAGPAARACRAGEPRPVAATTDGHARGRPRADRRPAAADYRAATAVGARRRGAPARPRPPTRTGSTCRRRIVFVVIFVVPTCCRSSSA